MLAIEGEGIPDRVEARTLLAATNLLVATVNHLIDSASRRLLEQAGGWTEPDVIIGIATARIAAGPFIAASRCVPASASN